MPPQQSVVLESKGVISIRDIDVSDTLGPNDCRVKMHSVGICGSDVHYYEHGSIGPYIVKEPMILGHECSGVITAVGKDVKHLQPGDRVALEPGIPKWTSTQTLAGLYNLDPDVVFFATPPVHGCLTPSVIHPAALCFKLPSNLSFEEGALCEPLAVGMHAATKAGIKPGDVALVIGCGTIGIVTALSALAGGCSDVIICDVVEARLSVAAQYPHVHPVLSSRPDDVQRIVDKLTSKQGVDRVFECSGAAPAYKLVHKYATTGATAVFVGMPLKDAAIDLVSFQAKEITVQTIFRYRNVYPKVIRLLSSGRINVKPLISAKFKFADSVKAFERACKRIPTDIKILIKVAADDDAKL